MRRRMSTGHGNHAGNVQSRCSECHKGNNELLERRVTDAWREWAILRRTSMSFSVVVPTVLRSEAVQRCVESVLRSAARTGQPHEVLLVVNGADRAVPPQIGSPA